MFEAFPKIPRLNREVVITEKLDGTNAQVLITPFNAATDTGDPTALAVSSEFTIRAGSRSRLLTTSNDNYGFARWVTNNSDELFKLGEGRHFGEWWGNGIQRGYGLKHKVFSLFNTHRWSNPDARPACCDVVPVLYQGPFSLEAVDTSVDSLRTLGSYAVQGFLDPEGIIVYHTAANHYFKVTCKDDASPKSMVA